MTVTAGLTTLLGTLGDVFTALIAKIGGILVMFTTDPILILLLGLMVTGAIFSFGFRLLHRR